MDTLVKTPTKEEVRQYLQKRLTAHSPPPDLEQIRRQLGWELLEFERIAIARCAMR